MTIDVKAFLDKAVFSSLNTYLLFESSPPWQRTRFPESDARPLEGEHLSLEYKEPWHLGRGVLPCFSQHPPLSWHISRIFRLIQNIILLTETGFCVPKGKAGWWYASTANYLVSSCSGSIMGYICRQESKHQSIKRLREFLAIYFIACYYFPFYISSLTSPVHCSRSMGPHYTGLLNVSKQY